MKYGTAKKIICFFVMGVILVALIIGNIFAYIYKQPITSFLAGTGDNFSADDAELQRVLKEGDELCVEMGNESVVLLRNENNALPLDMTDEKERTVNLFGIGAYDQGFMMKGVGSGSSTISPSRQVTLTQALEESGFTYNKDLASVYENFDFERGTKKDNAYNLAEPPFEEVNAKMAEARRQSDVAIMVISRNGGENIGEIPKEQADDKSRTYLDISKEEERLLEQIKTTFADGKVIVILNTGNAMHAGFLEDENIDAALSIGYTGQSAARSVAMVLSGEVNPSGKLTDTYVYSPQYDPAYANTYAAEQYTGKGHLQYSEDIYIGYKWYETADAEGYFNNVDNTYGKGYEGVVQYPFGYGLSYTDFSWQITDTTMENGGSLQQNSEVTFTVRVTNNGTVAGKDVVELYYIPPYYEESGIEKAEVNLVDFVKTDEIAPGGYQDVQLSFSSYDMASYSIYANGGKGAYILEEGTYSLQLRTDSHTLAKGNYVTAEYLVDEDIIFSKDPVSGNTVENRFTGENAYMNVPTDGSTVGITQKYLTRADFEGTFPAERAADPTDKSEIDSASKTLNSVYNTDKMPVTEQENGLRLTKIRVSNGKDENGNEQYTYKNATLKQLNGNDPLKSGEKLVFDEELMKELADYNSDKWDLLLNQMSLDELKSLVEFGGFHTEAVESIGKPKFADYDGPAGFNANSLTGNWSGETDKETWTAFPSETTLGCSWNQDLMYRMGQSMGEQARVTNLKGWYAPGVNLHRSAYTARNYEYYSEDAVLSGKMAANVITGAKSEGLYCYIKHFAASEMGPNPLKVNTWFTEQNFRENYLKPFEIAVKEGGANAVMTAFNRIGCVWAGANYALNMQILREEWGFQGSVITDYCAKPGDLGGMDVRQGVRAGNDLWLNASMQGALKTTDSTDMSCARTAAHNILYTIVDTWNDCNFDPTVKPAVFAWWGPVLVAIDVAVVIGFGIWTFFILHPRRKSK